MTSPPERAHDDADARPDETDPGSTRGLAFVPLTFALVLMFALTVMPRLFTHADGRAHHGATMLLAWAMSAGFVRGVGFVPRHAVWRWMFSTAACVLATAAGLALLVFANRAG